MDSANIPHTSTWQKLHKTSLPLPASHASHNWMCVWMPCIACKEIIMSRLNLNSLLLLFFRINFLRSKEEIFFFVSFLYSEEKLWLVWCKNIWDQIDAIILCWFTYITLNWANSMGIFFWNKQKKCRKIFRYWNWIIRLR